MSNRPEWQLRSLRRIQWRIMWLLVAAYVIAIAVAWLFYFVDKKPVNSGLIFVLPMILVSIVGVSMAYFRGVDDGQAHSKSDEPTKHI